MSSRLKIWIILMLSVIAAIVYAIINMPEITLGDIRLRKLNISSPPDNRNELEKEARKPHNFINGVDTARQTILFFGDSMTDGLYYRLDDYCQTNGHKLISITWYSATTQTFAESNLIDTYLSKYNPTFIMICLGSNELFVRDLQDRKNYIGRILSKIGHRPYIWISPPNWTKDTGLDSVIMQSVGQQRFFDSSRLDLQRSNDHIHPTLAASSLWMDHIASWISSPQQTLHPITMRKPQRKYHHEFRDYYPPEFKNFTGKDSPERHRRYFRISSSEYRQ